LGKHGIYSLLDAHQDIGNEKFCGQGFPSWAIKQSSLITLPFPFPLQWSAYPLDEHGRPSSADCGKQPWANYYFTHEVSSAWQALFDNVDGIQDSFAAFWRKVAENFASNDNVIGYEIINEPWSGNLWSNPLRMVPMWADYFNLQPMYDRVNNYIRQIDDKHLIFFESVTWDDFFPIGFSHAPGGKQFANRSVLSYHYYDQPNVNGIQSQIYSRKKDMKRLNIGGMMTEFDINVANLTLFNEVVETADDYLQSWIAWAYKNFYSPETGNNGLFHADGSVNLKVLKWASRTYAQAVAGKTSKMKFESSGAFELTYEVCENCGVTEIYLNQALHYPNGHEIAIKPENVAIIKEEGNYLYIEHKKGSNGVTLNINLISK